MERFIVMLEVSQKQAYIFGSNKLKDNIVNSAVIAHVLSEEYIAETLMEAGGKGKYSSEDNLVYSGGGHTVLEFDKLDAAQEMTAILTERIYRDFNGLCVFSKIERYDENLKVKKEKDESIHIPSANLKNLTEKLEIKKSIRKASFHQGSYGIEKISSTTLKPEVVNPDTEEKRQVAEEENKKSQKELSELGYEPAYSFEDLGGKDGESNFISVVHIDGNGMGKRVEELYCRLKEEKADWQQTKKALQEFSKGIDRAFKNAYREMIREIAKELMPGGSLEGKLNLSKKYFPVRRIITAGDDICFVSEGRIGLECARIFIEKLQNPAEGEGYSACAGVAIVHRKYPFYRAYELAEMLCSNAKAYGARIHSEDNGRSISSIDWHIEFGEVGDSLKEIRENYQTADGCTLELRPYIVAAPDQIMKDEKFVAKKYKNFRSIISRIQKGEDKFGTGKIKELRSAIKRGEIETRNYIHFNCMEEMLTEYRPHKEQIDDEDMKKLFTGAKVDAPAFIKIEGDEKKHSMIFDAIELMDTFFKVGE